MLALDNVSRIYPNGTQALDRLSLQIEAGEIVVMIGGSGCGKSTLLRLVSGLDAPTTGSVAIDGIRITEPHPAIGLVFQEPRLFQWLSVADNIGFGLTDLTAMARAKRVEAALKKIGLGGFGHRLPRELSGGQAQRVALARALVMEPSVLLLDEPFSALDAFTRADLQDHLLALWSETRPTLLLVTHDIEEALVLADRVIVMRPNPGRIAADIRIDLPRPRDRLSPAFEAAKRSTMRHLDASLNG